jgi:hypothetical protein
MAILSSSLGTEFTFLLLLPFVAWNLDMALGRKLMILWGIGFYTANYMRDLLLLPRPCHLSDSVVELLPNESSINPHGLPCVRTFSATAIPLYIAIATYQKVRPLSVAQSPCLPA